MGDIVSVQGDNCVLAIGNHRVTVDNPSGFPVGKSCKVVLRPEAGVLAETGDLPCKVVLSCFMGAYQNYHVMVGDTLVKLADYCPVGRRVFRVATRPICPSARAACICCKGSAFYCGFQCKFIAPGADASGRVLVRGNEGRNGDYGTFLSQESTKEPMCDVKVNWMKTGSGPGHLPPTCRPRGSAAFQFNLIDFHVTHRFFVTFFPEESNVSFVPYPLRFSRNFKTLMI